MKQEILMLLAKIRYALGDHQGALDRLEELALDSLPLTDISSRKMKLIGESFAIKGLHLWSTLIGELYSHIEDSVLRVMW